MKTKIKKAEDAYKRDPYLNKSEHMKILECA